MSRLAQEEEVTQARTRAQELEAENLALATSLAQVILASDWSPGRNTPLSLVAWPQYSPLIGHLASILTSDWSSARADAGPEAAGAGGPGGQPGADQGEARDRDPVPQRDQAAVILTSDWSPGYNTDL